MRTLGAIWPWLPAFRAVAETEHLPTAAKRLGTTPSSLSRTVSLVEDHLGERLFDRSGRRLQLNDAGRRLLVAVQEAMRGVEGALRPAAAEGPVRIAATMAMIEVLVQPALAALRTRHPAIVPHLLPPGPSEQVVAQLLDGTLDLALLEHPRHHDGLVVQRLLDLDYAVWCGPGHALYDREDVGVDEVHVMPLRGDPVAFVRSLGEHVVPRLAHL